MKQTRLFGLLLLGIALSLAVSGCVSPAKSRGWAAPVEEGGRILVASGAGRLDGLDSNGRQVWRFPHFWRIPDSSARNLDGIYSPPQLLSDSDGDVVFVGDYNGHVYAFRPGDFVDGVTVEPPPAASYKLNGRVIGGILLNEATDTLYATSDSSVYSIRASDLVSRIVNRDARVTAAVLFSTGGEIWGTPVLVGGKLLITSLDGNLYALDPVSGEEIWRFETSQGLVSTPTVEGDLVLVSGFGGEIFAVNLNDGSRAWSFKAGNWLWGRPVIGSGVAYLGAFDGKVHALNLASGAEVWSLDAKRGVMRASPALVGTTLVVSTDKGWLLGINTSSREVIWERDLGTSLNGDMTVDGGDVLFAPHGCVTPEGAESKVYYIKVRASDGNLSTAQGVC